MLPGPGRSRRCKRIDSSIVDSNLAIKHGLVVSFSPFQRDGRVKRQVSALAGQYRITVAAFGPAGESLDGDFLDLLSRAEGNESVWRRVGKFFVGFAPWGSRRRKFLLLMAAFLTFFIPRFRYSLSVPVRRLSRHLADNHYDFVVVNDQIPLPAVSKAVGPETPIYLDLHEYFPGQLTKGSIRRLYNWPLNRWIAKKFLAVPKFVTVVSDQIADLYIKRGFLETIPTVVRNVPIAAQLEPRCNEASESIRVVHHGGFSRSRNPEVLVDAVALLGEGYELTFYLVGKVPEDFIERARGKLGKRVHFQTPVPPQEIPFEMNQHDIGVHVLPMTSENHALAMPNKIFEFVQARLAVVVSPTPAMAEFVESSGVGTVTNGFEASDFAKTIKEIDPESLARFKRESHRMAAQLNWGVEQEVLLDGVSKMLKSR